MALHVEEHRVNAARHGIIVDEKYLHDAALIPRKAANVTDGPASEPQHPS
jgi:hypothetical protein